MSKGDRCMYCSKLIRYRKTNARPRKYCSDACKQRAYRLRSLLQQASSSTELQLSIWHQVWAEAGYPELLIAQLTELWHAYGHEGLMKIQAMLITHSNWKSEQVARILTIELADKLSES